MARAGLFDPTAVPAGWFDETAQPGGWFGEDLLESGAAAIVAVVSASDAADTIAAAGTVAPLVDDQPVSLGGRDKWERWRQDWMEAQPARAAIAATDGDDTISAAGAVWWRLRVASSRLRDDDDAVQASGVAVVFRRPGGIVRYTPKAEIRRTATR